VHTLQPVALNTPSFAQRSTPQQAGRQMEVHWPLPPRCSDDPRSSEDEGALPTLRPTRNMTDGMDRLPGDPPLQLRAVTHRQGSSTGVEHHSDEIRPHAHAHGARARVTRECTHGMRVACTTHGRPGTLPAMGAPLSATSSAPATSTVLLPSNALLCAPSPRTVAARLAVERSIATGLCALPAPSCGYLQTQECKRSDAPFEDNVHEARGAAMKRGSGGGGSLHAERAPTRALSLARTAFAGSLGGARAGGAA